MGEVAVVGWLAAVVKKRFVVGMGVSVAGDREADFFEVFAVVDDVVGYVASGGAVVFVFGEESVHRVDDDVVVGAVGAFVPSAAGGLVGDPEAFVR